MPKVSVIIPNYNNARYLAGCINSVRAQTFQDIEIIVIDDCSRDNSEKVIRDFAAADSRIVFLQTPKNSGGPGPVRNMGLDIARGEFILFLDSDDMLCPTAIDGMLTIQNATNADVIVGNYTRVPETFHIPDNANFMPPSFDFEGFNEPNAFVEKIENLNLVVVWTKLIRRATIGDRRFLAIYPYEDVEFMMRLYGAVRIGAITPNLAVYYRLSATSVIADKSRDVSRDVIAVLDSIAANMSAYDEDYEKFVKRYAYMFLRLWIGSILRKLKKPGTDRMYRRRLRHQMKSMARTVRRIARVGVFGGINISLKNRIALFLFGRGCVMRAGKTLAFKDGKI
ncbi:MAG: glycosyltransferase family 2 protein [Proteobacteria bacterium]|nr:glycosyltransferase family 2 protein [Pseudomonadota bacterium]